MFWLWELTPRCSWPLELVEEAEPGTKAPQEAFTPWAQEGSAMQEGLFLLFLSEIPAQLKRQSHPWGGQRLNKDELLGESFSKEVLWILCHLSQ